MRKISKKLCKQCWWRAPAQHPHRCDYALVTGICRNDPPGQCSHYKDGKGARHYDGDSETEEGYI